MSTPILDESTFREIRGEKLCWEDIGNPVAITINPGLHAGLSFYRVRKEPFVIQFPSEAGWKKLRMVLRPRTYKGAVVISAENASPVEVQFELIPSGNDVIPKILYKGPLKSWPI